MSENVVKTRNLGIRFGKTWAVRGVDLVVPSGSVTALMGLNGAGKTTALRLILDMLLPAEGEVEVFGEKTGPSVRAKIGYVAEAQSLYPWMRVSAFLDYVSGFYPTWDSEHLKSLAERFGLPMDKKIRELSRGIRARVALTAAMAHRPKLLVLDEPAAGLDVVVRKEFLEAMVELLQEEGRTVILSSHLIEDVERVADRMAVLHEGRLVLQESLDSLQARWKKATLVTTEAGAEKTWELPARWRIRSAEGRSVVLCSPQAVDDDLELLRRLPCVTGPVELDSLTFEEMFLDTACEKPGGAA